MVEDSAQGELFTIADSPFTIDYSPFTYSLFNFDL